MHNLTERWGGEWRKGWGRGIGFVYYNVVWGRRQRGKAMICYLAYSGKYININFILKIPFLSDMIIWM